MQQVLQEAINDLKLDSSKATYVLKYKKTVINNYESFRVANLPYHATLDLEIAAISRPSYKLNSEIDEIPAFKPHDVQKNDMNQDYSHLYYKRCGRMLPVNSFTDLYDLHQLCHTICNNILQHPHDMKYQQLKLSNKSIQTRLLTRHGGLDFLHAIGFEIQTHDFQKVLVLRNNENIQYGLMWLDETVNTCIDMAQCNRSQSSNSDKPCAECILQILISNTLTVIGGFMYEDNLESVVDFVKCFFKKEDPLVCLRLPNRSKAYEKECMMKTLEELELCPRSVLIASTLTDEQLADRMQQVKQKGDEDIKTNIANAVHMRQQQLKKKEKDDEYKQNLLLEFQDDRKNFKERNCSKLI
jgi:hypothetical protein